MKKISTVQVFRNEIFKEQKLMIGVDLGDRWSFYCVLDEAGKSANQNSSNQHSEKNPSIKTPNTQPFWRFDEH